MIAAIVPAHDGEAHRELALSSVSRMMRNGAAWIDEYPAGDARPIALRCGLLTKGGAKIVLDSAGSALGAAVFCRDVRFTPMAADLPVYVRQSHGEQDFAALGEWSAEGEGDAWTP